MSLLIFSPLATQQLIGDGEPGPARQLLWLWSALGAAVLLFAFILAIARSWYLRVQQQKEVERELLSEFREAVERGEMSAEEFARVRRLLVGRITGDSIVVSRPPAAQPAAPTSEKELSTLEQQTEAPPAAENADQPQESERKTDNASAPPQSYSAE